MSLYERTLPIRDLLSRKSLFLLGPRQTGKSTLLRQQLPEATYIDLLEADTFRTLATRPEWLREALPPGQTRLIIDEIQKMPALLDEVQLLIDRNASLRVVLTGSSASKLRRGGTNLLGGRAWVTTLHPLIFAELPQADIVQRLTRGGLPAIFDSPDYYQDLKAYVGTYLQEEIRAEGLARSVEGFSRFLEVTGLCSGQQLNFTAVANDAGVPARTVREHYQILVDTLVGHMVPAYQRTVKRKPVATAKFYFFDVGVANALARVPQIEARSVAFGTALEHQLAIELRAYLDYRRRDEQLTYWRSRSGFEVDFVIGDSVAVEVKSSAHVSDNDLRGLRALREEVTFKRAIVVATERVARVTADGIEILPVASFLAALWRDEIIN
ncbi:MAG: ATP-binding protein [Myxococcales bacterium]|nr:ATP-binding protein [Myxococcales bacterium]